MRRLSEVECLQAIEQGVHFEGEIDGIVEIKIEDYGFFICTAIHDGHHLREDLAESCLLTNADRLYEEDPHTSEMIAAMPVTLIGLDSRYEYDLNRAPEACVYEEAWGKEVWQKPLTAAQKQTSLDKHSLFFRILGALIQKTESLHGNCLIYDIHAYNHLRIENATPTFNIGTEQLNTKKWSKVINHWERTLSKIGLPNLDTKAAINDVFFGRGYLAAYAKQHFKRTLVLPTEIKKVYMDESTGEPYPLVLNALKSELKEAFLGNAFFFSKQAKPKTPKRKSQLLSSGIDPELVKLDTKLFTLCRGIATLSYINPKNIVKEKRRFFAKNFNYNPDFSYRQLNINPFEFRENLYRLPENSIADISIQQLYRDVIDTYAIKIDLLASIGTEKFLYNSLRYYGEPSAEDMAAAHFLLHAKEFNGAEAPTIDAKEMKRRFIQELEAYGIKCKVEITGKIIASAMVDNSRKAILINKSIRVNEQQLMALVHHELGVHIVTTMNSDRQKLKIFKLGLPGNTHTQEGLAILAEYMTGNLNLGRLKTLALRVIAVKMMVEHYDFSHTFKKLVNDYNVDLDEAFKLTARVYRAGGLTKDFLYLRGLREALKLSQKGSLSGLYVGKTSFEYLQLVNEMIERGMVLPPVHLPMYLQKEIKIEHNPILDYLLKSAF